MPPVSGAAIGFWIIACGTGALAIAAAERAGPEGAVTVLDPNPEMLAVAQAKPAAIDWCYGSAEALPFNDGDRH